MRFSFVVDSTVDTHSIGIVMKYVLPALNRQNVFNVYEYVCVDFYFSVVLETLVGIDPS